MAAESTHNRMEANAKAWLYAGHQESLDEIIDHINRLSGEDVSVFVNKYLKVSDASIAFVGNCSSMDKASVNEVLSKWGNPMGYL